MKGQSVGQIRPADGLCHIPCEERLQSGDELLIRPAGRLRTFMPLHFFHKQGANKLPKRDIPRCRKAASLRHQAGRQFQGDGFQIHPATL